LNPRISSADRVAPIGVLGGLGPRASAEFVQTIYGLARDSREQNLPSILMLSDPGYPDRSEAFLAGKTSELLARLTQDLTTLTAAGAEFVVICCVTMHYLMELLPAELRRHVHSLVDAVMEELRSTDGDYLMLCSNGTRKLGIFERHPHWTRLSHRVILPADPDQSGIHELIYRIKAGAEIDPVVRRLETILDRYQTRSIIAGCTEFHILVRELERNRVQDSRWRCIDPLNTLAQAISKVR
jgi:aspartate racemase